MEERRNKWWCDAMHEYNAPDIGAAISNALTNTTTFGIWGSGELTYTANDLGDAILKVCDRDYQFSAFDPYERIRELEEENKKLKELLKEYEL